MKPSEVDLASMLREIERSQEASSRAERLCQSATSDATRAHAVLDGVHDTARALVTRNRELRGGALGVRDALERARLATLNAGLEGARLGEPLGKAVVVMADELRSLLSRALETLDEHVSLLGELDRERERWLSELGQTCELSAASLQRLRELGGFEGATSQGLQRLRDHVARHVESDPERTRLLAEVSTQVRSLAESLGKLQQTGDAGSLSLDDALEPLKALLARSSGTKT